MAGVSHPGVSVYDRLRCDDASLSARLAAGQHRRELEALLGHAEYQTLAAAARGAQRTPARHGAPVYLLPGVLGTQLGWPRAAPLPADLLWIDPQDILAGRLSELRLPDGAGMHTLGALQYTYLLLRLRLQAAGFEVRVYDYDWRLDLAQLAAQFAARLRTDGAAPKLVVAHSMGGLIARAALALPGTAHVTRLVALGVPHGGAYGAVQALRGTYPVVRRLAAIDPHHDAETLSAEVFNTFPSLYALLPARRAAQGLDLHDGAHWPQSGPRPQLPLLHAARGFLASLPPPDVRQCAIAGTGQRTVVDVRLANDEFQYAVSSAGDGTVAVAAACLTGGRNYRVRCEHSALPRSAGVARALIDLLHTGRTKRLPLVAEASTRAACEPVWVGDNELRTSWTSKVDWAHLAPDARRDYLNRLNQPPALYGGRRPRRRTNQ